MTAYSIVVRSNFEGLGKVLYWALQFSESELDATTLSRDMPMKWYPLPRFTY